MNTKMQEIKYRNSVGFMVVVLLVVVSIYFGIKSFSELHSESLLGSKMESTIVLSGHGEVSAVPDIATINFTIRKSAKTSKEAQDMVSEIEGKALSFLRENNIADKDIKTNYSSLYPKYEYKYEPRALYPCNEYGCPPLPGRNTITGYESSESIAVKIRNTDDAGKIIEGLSGVGVGELNGPNFEIDDEEGLKAEARKKAIDDAKSKAEVLARDLGVRLGKVVNFNESGNYPMPMYATKGMAMDMAESAPVTAELPKGENIISTDVTITYEIK